MQPTDTETTMYFETGYHVPTEQIDSQTFEGTIVITIVPLFASDRKQHPPRQFQFRLSEGGLVLQENKTVILKTTATDPNPETRSESFSDPRWNRLDPIRKNVLRVLCVLAYRGVHSCYDLMPNYGSCAFAGMSRDDFESLTFEHWG